MSLSHSDLPCGSKPTPVDIPHFPHRLHAFIWRNWTLVPLARIARVIDATIEQVLSIGRSMGLPNPTPIPDSQWRRSYITIIRRNWHLLPYEQLLQLLDWSAEEMAYVLREDDFLYHKLGNLKPDCPLLTYDAPDVAAISRVREIASLVKSTFPDGAGRGEKPLFAFIEALSKPPVSSPRDFATRAARELASGSNANRFSLRYCSSYFTMYGDTLLEAEDSYPDGYLERLAQSGVNGIWLQGVLYKLALFPWASEKSEKYTDRLAALRNLVARAKKYGIGVYMYLNEPRAMPLAFYAEHPELQGVQNGDFASMCTSVPSVRDYIRSAVESICRIAPDLAGLFTISASENQTHCWSHDRGDGCPRCNERTPAEVIAELHTTIQAGISDSGANTRLIAWDWGWRDDWIEDIVQALPKGISLQSVSEWSIPIERGGVKSVIGEYSVSEPGPGPRAKRTWATARDQKKKTIAKIQANCTWELSSVPYIPAVENVAIHALNLCNEGVDGLMLGWTLGGCPSPNLEVVSEVGGNPGLSADSALSAVAQKRYGPEYAPHVVEAWKSFSAAFREFPYHIGVVYNGPQQMGPANLLWEKPTGFSATMVGFPYDDLDRWRAVFPEDVYIGQFEKVAEGIEKVVDHLQSAMAKVRVVTAAINEKDAAFATAIADEVTVMTACGIHFRSVANQARFVVLRRSLEACISGSEKERGGDAGSDIIGEIQTIVEGEIELALRLYELQCRDSRFGFEASNHYFYVPLDLAEKVLCCHDLLDRWLPWQRERLTTI